MQQCTAFSITLGTFVTLWHSNILTNEIADTCELWYGDLFETNYIFISTGNTGLAYGFDSSGIPHLQFFVSTPIFHRQVYKC